MTLPNCAGWCSLRFVFYCYKLLPRPRERSIERRILTVLSDAYHPPKCFCCSACKLLNTGQIRPCQALRRPPSVETNFHNFPIHYHEHRLWQIAPSYTALMPEVMLSESGGLETVPNTAREKASARNPRPSPIWIVRYITGV